jgi:hypothetical protein
MGSGNLGHEVQVLAELLATVGVSARQALRMHLHVLEELVMGLGNRSTRHVMTRADLLAVEVMLSLADGYRQRYRERKLPPRQLTLPGFESCQEPPRDHALSERSPHAAGGVEVPGAAVCG